MSERELEQSEAEDTAPTTRVLEFSARTALKWVCIFNAVVASIWTIVQIFALDALTGFVGYTGIGKIFLMSFAVLLTFAVSFMWIIIAEIVVIGGLVVFYIAFRTIFGKKGAS